MSARVAVAAVAAVIAAAAAAVVVKKKKTVTGKRSLAGLLFSSLCFQVIIICCFGIVHFERVDL